MRDEHDGLAQQLLQPKELVLHLAADQRIERREGLVEEPDVRSHRERARDAHTLLLATRELSREVVLAALQPNEPNHFAGSRIALLACGTAHLKRKGDVREHGTVRQKAKVLEHHAHLVPPDVDQFGRSGLEQVTAIEDDLASSRVVEAGDGADQG